MPNIEVKVASYPDCDLCEAQVKSGKRDNVLPARYDGVTRMGPWAYMCPAHFQEVGVGLGVGVGQRFVLEEESYVEPCWSHAGEELEGEPR